MRLHNEVVETFSQSQTRIGLAGVGLMGRGMGLRLLRRGHRLGVLAHRQRANVDALVGQGAQEHPTPAALAAEAEVLLLCLPSEEAVMQVLFGERGVVHGARRGLLVIDSSTLEPAASRRCHARLAEHGIAHVDAPVTRGPNEAEQGRLNALVGGDADAVARARPVLDALCESVFVFGGPGMGQSAKLVSNFLAFSQFAAVADALGTAARAGLDRGTLLRAIAVSGGQSRVLDNLAPWLLHGEAPRSRVTLRTAHKDVRCYRDMAAALGSTGLLEAAVEQALAAGVEAGLADALTPDYLRWRTEPHGADLPELP